MNLKHIVIDDRIFLDLEREKRTLIPEVIYAYKKSNNDLVSAIKVFIKESSRVFISRLSPDQISFLRTEMDLYSVDELPDLNKEEFLIVDQISGCAWYESSREESSIKNVKGSVGLITAGTSDLAVLLEAKSFLQFNRIETCVFADIGVASLARLFYKLPEIQKMDILLVFAGMEAALPSVLAGLTPKPIIAIPTSTGYGVSQGGFSALLTTLSSCSPGVLAVNIDNGIGAAASAIKILGIKGESL